MVDGVQLSQKHIVQVGQVRLDVRAYLISLVHQGHLLLYQFNVQVDVLLMGLYHLLLLLDYQLHILLVFLR